MQTVSIHEIFEEMSDKFNKTFYYEDILEQLIFASEDDYKKLSEKYGAVFLQNLLSDMEKYFNSKAQNKLKNISNISDKEFEEIQNELKRSINAIVRFRNGAMLNPISEKLLREGGFIRGTREFLTKDILKRREMFANSLIGVYDAVESEKEYSKRAENEKSDIDEVINALYYNRFENFFKNIEVNEQEEFDKIQFVRMAQILKIVKLIENTIKKDILREFLTIPDVNLLMIKLEKDETGYLKECMIRAQIRIKKVIYPETEAENGKYKKYILGVLEDSGEDMHNKVMMLSEELKNKAKGD